MSLSSALQLPSTTPLSNPEICRDSLLAIVNSARIEFAFPEQFTPIKSVRRRRRRHDDVGKTRFELFFTNSRRASLWPIESFQHLAKDVALAYAISHIQKQIDCNQEAASSALYCYLGSMSEEEAKDIVNAYATPLESGFKAIYSTWLQSMAHSAARLAEASLSSSHSDSQSSFFSTFSRITASSSSTTPIEDVLHRKRRLSDTDIIDWKRHKNDAEEAKDSLPEDKLQDPGRDSKENEQDIEKSWSQSWLNECEVDALVRDNSLSFADEGSAFIESNGVGAADDKDLLILEEETNNDNSFIIQGNFTYKHESFFASPQRINTNNEWFKQRSNKADVDEDESFCVDEESIAIDSYLINDASVRAIVSSKPEESTLGNVILSPMPSTAAVLSFEVESVDSISSIVYGHGLVTDFEEEEEEEEALVLGILDLSNDDDEAVSISFSPRKDASVRALASFSMDKSTRGRIMLSPTPSNAAVRSFGLGSLDSFSSISADDELTDVDSEAEESMVLGMLNPAKTVDILDLAAFLHPSFTREEMQSVLCQVIDAEYDSIVDALRYH